MPRPHKSEALHELQGTQLRSNVSESHIGGALPRPPSHLSKPAKKSFRGFVRQLAERRAVTSGDAALLGMLCVIEERWLAALENLRTEGVVVEVTRLDSNGQHVTTDRPNLSLRIAETCERSMTAILGKLGLTPRDRELVKPTGKAASHKKEPTVSERLAEEIKALEAAQAAAPVPDDFDLDSFDETIADAPKTEAEKLMQEIDAALDEAPDERQ